jgi:TusA-related sulfurtransferase
VRSWHAACFTPRLAQIEDRLRELGALNRKADYHLDLRGAITPITLLKATEVFRQMKCDEVLEVVSRDSDTRNDLLKVLPPRSFDLIVNEEIAEDMSYRIQLIKRR